MTDSVFTQSSQEIETPVLIVGGGPIGLLAARSLSLQGISSVLVERNKTTTKWPKMELINARTMELFRSNKLDLADWVRSSGVPPEYKFNVLFSSGFSEGGQVVEKWEALPSVNEFRAQIKDNNDGSMPREPWQRSMQSILEAKLKDLADNDANVHGMWGVRFDSLVENEEGVVSTCTVLDTGEQMTIRSQYVIGCDGASSKVRHSIGAEIRGGPLPLAFYLVHFRSTDLTALHKQGRFWHILFLSGGVFIAQNEKDEWTAHLAVAPDVDPSTLDPHTVVSGLLGGSTGRPFAVDIDEILVQSTWRPSIYVTDKYASTKRRVFLAGDSAHQLIPTGGFSFNTGVGDAVGISWKLAAVLKGRAGTSLLDSYEVERKPVAERNNERSGLNMSVHTSIWERVAKAGAILDPGAEGEALRKEVSKHYLEHNSENSSWGLEFGYRYNGSPVLVAEDSSDEPRWSNEDYVPSTWPGARAPHVFLKDGSTSTFDVCGGLGEYTIFDFTKDASFAKRFETAAGQARFPLKVVHLPDETHAREVWQRDAVLIRPDDHVCWRVADGSDVGSVNVQAILEVVSGRRKSADPLGVAPHLRTELPKAAFTGTVGAVDFDQVQEKGAFQL